MSLRQIVVAADQFINALLGGYADETFSSRCWRCRAEQPYAFLRRAIDTVLWFDPDHCEMSYNSERQRKYFPRELQ